MTYVHPSIDSSRPKRPRTSFRRAATGSCSLSTATAFPGPGCARGGAIISTSSRLGCGHG